MNQNLSAVFGPDRNNGAADKIGARIAHGAFAKTYNFRVLDDAKVQEPAPYGAGGENLPDDSVLAGT